jgi:hypothetical protein
MKNYFKKIGMLGQSSPRRWNKMMQKSITFTTIFLVKKCHFHYDMQKTLLNYPVNVFFLQNIVYMTYFQ